MRRLWPPSAVAYSPSHPSTNDPLKKGKVSMRVSLILPVLMALQLVGLPAGASE